MWGCKALDSGWPCRPRGATGLGMAPKAVGARGAPNSGQPLGEASWRRLVLCSCHGMQGTLLAPFAWFATQKCQLGAPPSSGRVTLFFLFSQDVRAGRCPSWGARQSTPQSPNPRVRLCTVLPSARELASLQGLQWAVSRPGSAAGFVSVVLMSGFGNGASQIIFHEAGKAVDCGLSGAESPTAAIWEGVSGAVWLEELN